MPCSSAVYTVKVSLSPMYTSFVHLVRGDTAAAPMWLLIPLPLV
jgi:hypothetical protein